MGKKRKRFGNPARQAKVDEAETRQLRAAEAAAIAAAQQLRQAQSCAPSCRCGDACCA